MNISVIIELILATGSTIVLILLMISLIMMIKELR